MEWLRSPEEQKFINRPGHQSVLMNLDQNKKMMHLPLATSIDQTLRRMPLRLCQMHVAFQKWIHVKQASSDHKPPLSTPIFLCLQLLAYTQTANLFTSSQ